MSSPWFFELHVAFDYSKPNQTANIVKVQEDNHPTLCIDRVSIG